MIGSGTNLVMTVIGFGMSATFIVYFCSRLFCGRVQMGESRRVVQRAMPSDLEPLEHTIIGLERVVVETFPTLQFSAEVFCCRQDDLCPICLGEYEDEEILRIMPTCGHAFHLNCIDVWLQEQSTCPVCRLTLQDSYEGKHLMPPTFSMVLGSTNSPDSTEEQSYQWLLPGGDHSEIQGSERERDETEI